MRVHLALHRGLIYLLPFALLFVALIGRVAASDLLERLSLFASTSIKRPPRARRGACQYGSSTLMTAALAKIGQWPWPRTVVAQLVDKLREAGAAVVAFDIDFAEPDRTSPQLLLPLLARNGVRPEEAERLLAVVPDPDQRLAEAMGSVPVATGFILTDRGETRLPLPKAGFVGSGTIRSAISPTIRQRFPTCRSWKRRQPETASSTSLLIGTKSFAGFR